MDFKRILLLAILCWAATPAWASTLDVTGPAGAALYLDGEPVGELPLDGPLQVPQGQHTVELRLAGYQSHFQKVQLAKPDTNMVLQLSLLPLQRWRAATYSGLLAGLGQLYEGRSRRGWVMMGLQVAVASVAAYGEAQFQTHRDDYEILDRKYAAAVAPSEIAALREQRAAAYDDMDTAEKIRNVALISTVAVGVWSVLDAWWGFDSVYIEAPPAREMSLVPSDTGSDFALRMGWRHAF